ncbi:MAG TPA: DUF4296 domain-containing protein [Flavipsychrobacter sp.]|nr:DUF4296 domain-containing protein [Flavipsychrobacter sp.]
MKKYILLLLLPLAITACTPKSDHIPPKQMKKIMLDINLAESYSSISKKDTAHKIAIKNPDSLAFYYKEILAHYKISQQEFAQSMQWYKEHPEDLDSIYAAIIPELSKDQAVIQAKK